jgi:hypothetical protein
MFDSFMIEIDGSEVELQTKLFENILGYYHVGDVVAGATTGIRVYFDNVWFDSENKKVYASEKWFIQQLNMLRKNVLVNKHQNYNSVS